MANTTFEDAVLAAFPEFTFFMNDASGGPQNSGTGSHFTVEVNIDFEQTGPAVTPKAIGMDLAASESRVVANDDWQAAATEGTLILAFKTDALSMDPSEGSVMISTGENPQSNAMHFWFSINPAGGLLVRLFLNNNDGWQILSSGVAVADDVWHLAIIRQPADGTGVELFIDTRTDVGTSKTEHGTSDFDWWWADMSATNIDYFTLGNNTSNTDRWNDGDIALFGMDDSALSDGVIDAIFDLWGGAGGAGDIFALKNVRRSNRRLFSPLIS
jgi:hypothetical protein